MNESEQNSVLSREQIVDAWQSVVTATRTRFSAVSEAEFSAERDGRWSLAENLDHLVRSAKPVAKALTMPKLVLWLLFGRGGTSRPLSEVRSAYRETLDRGGQASGRFVPGSQRSQKLLLDEWDACGSLLLRNLDRWSESQLDVYRLPHPLIGKLTVREMLFFTIFHTQHHLDNVERS